MKRLKRFPLLVLVLSLLAGSNCKRKKPPFKKEYSMQITVGPTTYWGMGAARFAELVEEKTGGRILVKPYYGSQLLKGAQLNAAQMVAMGSIDLALDSTINMAPMIQEMNVFSLPFLLSNYDELDALEEGDTARLLSKAMRDKGLTHLGWGENGFRWLTNSKRPVQTPEDLQGLRIRVVGSPLFVDLFRHLGADPVNMNWGDAVTAFQQGTVDGQENPVQILLAVQIHQYHRYLTAWHYLADPLILYWNQKEFDAFPDEIQRQIREAAEEACLYQKCLARVGLDDGEALSTLETRFETQPEVEDPLTFFQQQGVAIATLNEGQINRFRQETRPILEAWVEKIGKPVYQAAMSDLGRDAGGS